MNGLIDRLDPWAAAVTFLVSMVVFWCAGWGIGRRTLRAPEEDPGKKFTDASMALLGLLLAFTFSMALGRYDQRRQAVVQDCNAIGDFYTCATLLNDPAQSQLQDVLRNYARFKLDSSRQSGLRSYPQKDIDRCLELQSQMTALARMAIAGGTSIAVSLTECLNNVTSAHATLLEANEARLPRIILILLFVGSIVPSLLMGLQQGVSKSMHLSGTISFFLLVTFVIYATLDLNQASSGLIRVSDATLERLIQSMGK